MQTSTFAVQFIRSWSKDCELLRKESKVHHPPHKKEGRKQKGSPKW